METLGTGAAQLNLLFQIGSARSIYFDFNTDISSYTFEFVLKKNKGARVKILSLTLGSGISFTVYESERILVSFSTTNTSIEEGEYYWELRKSNSNICLINGFAYFSYDAPSGSLDGSLSLTVDSQTVSVTVSNTSQDGVMIVKGTYDASSNAFPSTTGIKKGWWYKISVGGTLGGVEVSAGAKIMALIDSPGNTLTDWDITY